MGRLQIRVGAHCEHRIEPVVMSAGELESEWAGAPGRLIRERYRRAAEVAKVRGKLPCLMINDLDAGVGIQEGVQRTVRTTCRLPVG